MNPSVNTQHKSKDLVYEKELNNIRLYPKIMKVLNTKSGTLIVFAEGLAVGNAFKDLVSSLILNVIMPTLVYICKYFKITKLVNFINTKTNVLNIYLFINNLSIFIMLCVIIYYLNENLGIY